MSGDMLKSERVKIRLVTIVYNSLSKILCTTRGLNALFISLNSTLGLNLSTCRADIIILKNVMFFPLNVSFRE